MKPTMRDIRRNLQEAAAIANAATTKEQMEVAQFEVEAKLREVIDLLRRLEAGDE